MDVSVVAAVGSFVMSERVLKPKATALFILGCILAYDLTTKTHDVSSLRVYRGPALLAFTLMMAAYSLRTWRRNGVACDELIFLPGTQHGHEHGIEGPLIEQLPSPVQEGSVVIEASHGNNLTGGGGGAGEVFSRQFSEPLTTREADMAAGGSHHHLHHKHHHQGELKRRSRSEDEIELSNMAKGSLGANSGAATTTEILPNTSTDEEDAPAQGELLLGNSQHNSNHTKWKNNRPNSLHDQPINGDHATSWDMDEQDDDDDTSPTRSQMLLHRSTFEPNEQPSDGPDASMMTPARPNRIQRWGENHPRIARLGTFFFFRSSASTSNNTNAAYAPSGPAVFGAGLDLSMPVLFNFHLFIEAFNHIQGADESETPAKILPLIFLSVLIVRTVIPPSRRMRFWGTMKFTFTAPFHTVRVRDEFIGDCLTSWVRPGQDLFFALSYYCTVIYGTITGKYGLTESGEMLADSWTLHNVIMPAFAILPLWLKYLQTLRQAYDSNQRWPYQGNSLKYLISSLVIIYGMTHPEQRKSVIWISCFVVALLYQIFWDVVMDWQLFEIQRDITIVTDSGVSDPEGLSCCATSFRPESRFLLTLQMYLVQPVLDRYQRLRSLIPSWRHIQLRQQRLYKTDSFYWKIFAYNTITRFTWMCCFIPAYHITRSRTVLTSTSDVNSYWGVLLPASEILRRTFWGFLYMEKETLKMMEADAKYQRVNALESCEEDYDMDDMNSKFGEHRSFRNSFLPTWLDNQQQVAQNAATKEAKQREQFLRQIFVMELYVWAAAFVVLGGLAAR
ncbi:EXS family protein [Nitzschia inconspicua]|uniref:EXS family protein n=1 Tax=Nitzschia inconspicua TaxID=303405 RepID=A0A9K3L9X6_9STRA|nr:EXS family protein [Nitzschia inconspicua]